MKRYYGFRAAFKSKSKIIIKDQWKKCKRNLSKTAFKSRLGKILSMIVYGKQIFFYILEYHKDCINELYLAKECDKITFSKIAKSGFKIKKLDFKTAQAYAKGGNHQGFLLDIKESSFANLNEIKKMILLLCFMELVM